MISFTYGTPPEHRDNRLVVARGGGLRVCKMGDGGQKIQTSNYKINVMGTAW